MPPTARPIAVALRLMPGVRPPASTLVLVRADHLHLLWNRDSHVLPRTRAGAFSCRVLRTAGEVRFWWKVLGGEMRSSKARQRIRRWAQLHRAQLEANWERMKAGQMLETIEPLSEEKR
jgi:hypothetical protein